MTFLLAMQAPAGTTMAIVPGVARAAKGPVPVATDVSGMAFHKVADEHSTALPFPPQDDPARLVLFPPSTAATLNLAAPATPGARSCPGVAPARSEKHRVATNGDKPRTTR